MDAAQYEHADLAAASAVDMFGIPTKERLEAISVRVPSTQLRDLKIIETFLISHGQDGATVSDLVRTAIAEFIAGAKEEAPEIFPAEDWSASPGSILKDDSLTSAG